ncbi:MAG: ribosome biogenesis GTPase Der [Chloroflexi bacterium RBG_16_56_11]|nr:MAG: ribosome biogenesis GTPase Der [Chloroflexi bacterium RBG_16_56_11]
MSRPIVAIVGRPNVGKSTLYNKIVGKPVAITEDQPGTTRDRNIADASWRGVEFTLIDTGGLELKPDTPVGRGIKAQIDTAIREADIIIDLVDVAAGATAADFEVADMLRRAGKPVLLAANKADNDRLEAQAVDFYRLGIGDPVAISSHHGRGVAELLDRVVELLPGNVPATPIAEAVKVAIVGRPNVGKSMLLNALVGDERAIVDDAPGTTRDAVDTLVDFHGQSVLLIDTAGIRRRGQVKVGVERFSVMRTFRAIDRADIALLVLDATEMVTAQDAHIAGYIQEAARGIIIVVNKWDLIKERDTAGWNKLVRSQIKFASYAPILYTSAKSGQGVDRIMPQVIQVYQERTKRLATATVNNIVQQAVASHTRPRAGRRQLKIFYATQAEVNPPTFVFFTNDSSMVHFSYRRYLENRLRQVFGFTGTPLRLIFKTRRES